MWQHMALFFVMLEKWTKKLTGKATTEAVATVKETLNDKLEHYSGIIKFGLTMGVIAFGSRILNKKPEPQQPVVQQPPIIINNYYQERSPYGQAETYREYQDRREHRDLCRDSKPHAPRYPKRK